MDGRFLVHRGFESLPSDNGTEAMLRAAREGCGLTMAIREVVDSARIPS